MFNQDPSRIYHASPTAILHHKRFKQFGAITYGLLAIVGVIGLWTILKVMGVFDSEIPDLADIASIRDHISTRLVTILAIVTAAIYVFKEWRYGERSVLMLVFLGTLLGFWLLPVVAAELEPDEAQLEIEFTLNACEAGSITGPNQVDTSLCKIVDPEQVPVLMSDADPTRKDAEIREPDALLTNLSRWFVVARGDFYVYFMLQHESMATCEQAVIGTNERADEDQGYTCTEIDGSAWSVHKFETGELQTGRLVVYIEQP